MVLITKANPWSIVLAKNALLHLSLKGNKLYPYPAP